MGLDELQERYRRFIEERDWEQFHRPKNVSMALSVEASELMELFMWKDNLDADRFVEDDDLVDAVREEIADIIIYSLSLVEQFDIDLEEAVRAKLAENEQRFDEETVRQMNEELEDWLRE